MAKRDYNAEDKALTEQLKAGKGKTDTPENPEMPVDTDNDMATEGEESPEEQAAEGETEMANEGEEPTQKPASEPSEETVPKSRYDESVKAMNKSQQEAAALRKEIEALKSASPGNEGESKETSNAEPVDLQEAVQDAGNEVHEMPTDEELGYALEAFPEVLNPILKITGALQKRLDELEGNVKPVVGKFQSESDSAAEQERAAQHQAAWEAILAEHPDVEEITKSPEFGDWRDKSSDLVKGILDKGTPPEVNDALHMFKAKMGKGKAAEMPPVVAEKETIAMEPDSATPPVDKLAAAKNAAPPALKANSKPGDKPTFRSSQVKAMSPKEYAANEKAIDEAMKDGRYIQD